MKRKLDDQKILFKGCTYSPLEEGSNEAPKHGEMFFIFNGKDERDPHAFIMSDQYYINGLIRSWEIKELDLVHAERDDELMVSTKFR